jgi:hypothetical protein
MDLFIRVLMVPFGWSQFEAANWALVPTLIYWKIGFSGHFHFYYLFVKFTHHERIKTNNRCCFLFLNLYLPRFAIGRQG